MDRSWRKGDKGRKIWFFAVRGGKVSDLDEKIKVTKT